ncbi:MAG: hypothetical protein EB037_12260 [Actinobacteria bacterium]|nr:hypothetical protein [Actinomycetota bacterium]
MTGAFVDGGKVAITVDVVVGAFVVVGAIEVLETRVVTKGTVVEGVADDVDASTVTSAPDPSPDPAHPATNRNDNDIENVNDTDNETTELRTSRA